MKNPKKYVLAGKKETFSKYYKEHWNEEAKNILSNKGPNIYYANALQILNTIEEDDTIVLLHGWWGRSWAKDAINAITKKYPKIKFEYLDGEFGEKERKDLISERVHDRFELLDLS